jgi:hypothetical protein
VEKEYDEYTIGTLIEALESIKENGQGDLNFPKAFYCLAKEIKKIKDYLRSHKTQENKDKKSLKE